MYSPAPVPEYTSQPGPEIEMEAVLGPATPLHMLGEEPETIDCPFCLKRTRTLVEKKGTSKQVYVSSYPIAIQANLI